MKLCWAFDVNTGRRADKAARCGGVLSDQTKQKRASWILHQHSKIVPGDSLVHTEKYTGRQTFFFFCNSCNFRKGEQDSARASLLCVLQFSLSHQDAKPVIIAKV